MESDYVTCVCCRGLLRNPGEDRGNKDHGANWVTAILLSKYLCLLSLFSFLAPYPQALCTAESIFFIYTFTVLTLEVTFFAVCNVFNRSTSKQAANVSR